MTKHIHIHLPPGVTVSQVRTGDSDWDESKHKRDDGGKFSSGGGGGGNSAPIKHASATGQSFLPKQSSVAAGSVVKTGSGFTAKNPQGFKEFFKPHEEAQALAWAAGTAHKEPAAKMPELKVRGFTATAEAGSDGTYRAKLLNEDGSIHRLTATSFKTPQEAAEHAEQLALGNKPATTAKQGPSAPAGGDPADHGFASMSVGQRHAFSQQAERKAPHIVGAERAIEMKKALAAALGPQADVKAHTGGEAGAGQAVLTKREGGKARILDA